MSAEVVRLLDQHGLGALADAVVPTARRCAYLVVSDTGSGRSRFLGDPDLPPGTPWPANDAGEPLRFVLQVDLAAVPADVRGPLPSSGLLSLFAGVEEPATDVDVRVLLSPDGPLEPAPTPGFEVESWSFDEARPCALEIVPMWDLPRWATDDHDELTADLGDDGVDAYDDATLTLRPPGRSVLARLFGHAAGIGHDPRHDAHVVRDVDPALLYDYEARARLDLAAAARAWQHLLTVYSCDDAGVLIWDAGYLQVLVRDDHLAALRFDHLYAAVESS